MMDTFLGYIETVSSSEVATRLVSIQRNLYSMILVGPSFVTSSIHRNPTFYVLVALCELYIQR